MEHRLVARSAASLLTVRGAHMMVVSVSNMARATISIAVDEPAQVRAGEEWLTANHSRLSFISENYGCGCCVDLYDMEGPDDLLATIPDLLRTTSDWTLVRRSMVATQPDDKPKG